jgi:molybdenum-dependent DNA-binding transcriptional regulator ModE
MKAGNKTSGPRLRDISDTNAATGPGQEEILQAIAATGSISKPETGARIADQRRENRTDEASEKVAA